MQFLSAYTPTLCLNNRPILSRRNITPLVTSLRTFVAASWSCSIFTDAAGVVNLPNTTEVRTTVKCRKMPLLSKQRQVKNHLRFTTQVGRVTEIVKEQAPIGCFSFCIWGCVSGEWTRLIKPVDRAVFK